MPATRPEGRGPNGGGNPSPFGRTQTERGRASGEEDQRLTRPPPKTPHVPKTSLLEKIRGSTKLVLFGSKLNILLVFLPFSFLLRYLEDGESNVKYDAGIFIVSMLALCPLAERLGFITEELASYTNDTIGGLLNATFGNATEVIICGFALAEAKNNSTFLRVVQLSLLGSVLSNLLLVLGSAFLVGGIVHPSQNFNQEGMTVNSGLLLMAVSAILLPSILKASGTEQKQTDADYGKSSELYLSRFESVFLLACYGFYLVFQLCTHRHLYEDEDEDEIGGDNSHAESDDGNDNQEEPLDRHMSGFQNRREAGEGTWVDPRLLAGDMETGEAADVVSPLLAYSSRKRISTRRLNAKEDEVAALLGSTTILRRHTQSMEEVADVTNTAAPPKEPEGPSLGMGGALIWLTIVTVLIAVLSEFIVSSIEGAANGLNIPLPFLSTIVLPIVGNAAEHASAILFAYKNRMEITLGVAVGSSTQVAVLVIPFCVILSWVMGEDLDLNFKEFESVALFLSVLLVIVAMNDGTSNWLKGIMLSMTYVFVSAAFWMHFDAELTPPDTPPGPP
eukprot:evm.model.scf_3183.2 EVM.evm.TU.scf_3183.2   scf_3183:3245-10191(-)